MWVKFNPNPAGKSVGDCVIRAISVVLNQTWQRTYDEICRQGRLEYDMPSSDAVWGAYLRNKGFEMHIVPDTCPHCYTVKDFCKDHPLGVYVLGTGRHAIGVVDGNHFDAWDSSNESIIYYWRENNGI